MIVAWIRDLWVASTALQHCHSQFSHRWHITNMPIGCKWLNACFYCESQQVIKLVPNINIDFTLMRFGVIILYYLLIIYQTHGPPFDTLVNSSLTIPFKSFSPSLLEWLASTFFSFPMTAAPNLQWHQTHSHTIYLPPAPIATTITISTLRFFSNLLFATKKK